MIYQFIINFLIFEVYNLYLTKKNKLAQLKIDENNKKFNQKFLS